MTKKKRKIEPVLVTFNLDIFKDHKPKKKKPKK